MQSQAKMSQPYLVEPGHSPSYHWSLDVHVCATEEVLAGAANAEERLRHIDPTTPAPGYSTALEQNPQSTFFCNRKNNSNRNHVSIATAHDVEVVFIALTGTRDECGKQPNYKSIKAQHLNSITVCDYDSVTMSLSHFDS